ncbi:glycerol kinase-like isoform X2 [Microplitis mediator]|uniref:glycerol kinase-like isoform X2 n=1 Tax=Microplitis mediator TaxID=375433 RepID=UPI0025524398|nr:glycerol kinase-like isoform X2 [Microplitis mediator]
MTVKNYKQMIKNESMNRYGPLVGAIDAGTSNVRFMVFAADTAEVLTYHQTTVPLLYPHEGWVEQDPVEIITAVRECLNQTVINLEQLRIDPADIVAIGVTNQRETTVVWDHVTGEPLNNAIVWMDTRTAVIVDDVLKEVRNKNKNYLKPLCGLPISPYFSALKLKWLLANVPRVQEAVDSKRCMFGTIDSWIIWNLTGGTNGGAHSTDVTNASRTMLMNITTLKWDPILLGFFNIPKEILPQIRSSSEIYGFIQEDMLKGVPISGCLGDQQSALLGQMCLQRGKAKSTYGTGCFLLYNTGTSIVQSQHGLLTTVAYQLGPKSQPIYALEGSIAIAGIILDWLRNNLNIFIDSSNDTECITHKNSTADVTFVPAFTGLYAPYWHKDAKSIICGITYNTTSTNIIKAALQAICFQIRDILESIKQDTGFTLGKLLVDGSMTSNNLLMQMQADISGIPEVRPLMSETSALGVAIAAGCADGIKVWDLKVDTTVPSDIFMPMTVEDERDILYDQWKKTVEKSFGWESSVEKNFDASTDIYKVAPGGIFVVSTIIVLVIAKYRSCV